MYNSEAKISHPTTTSSVRLFIAALFASLLSAAALAQGSSLTDGHTPSGIAPGAPAGSFALSGFDNISPYSGHLNFRLPLLTVGGRGRAGYTMTLPIEHQWRVMKSVDNWYANFNWWTDFKPGYGPGVFNVRPEAYSAVDCLAQTGSQMEWYLYSLTRLTFTTPDGTEYEFRDALNNGSALPNDRCGVYDRNNRGHVWVTADGTSATFITDYDIYDNQFVQSGGQPINPDPNAPAGPELLRGYLILRDGTRYRIDKGHVSWIRDTNGNTVNFTYDGNGYGNVTEIRDSINRRVTISYGNPDVITFKGFGGADRTIKIWSNLLSDQNPATRILRNDLAFPLKSTGELFPLLDGSGAPADAIRYSAVELPDGRQYKFKYNYYGELARVELPTGGAFEYDWGPGPGADASGVIIDFAVGGGIPPERRNIYRRVTERRVYKDASSQGSLESRMTFTPTHPGYSDPRPWTTVVKIVQKDAEGTLLAASRHYYYGSPTGSMVTMPLDYTEWDDGKEYQAEVLADDSEAPLVLRRITHNWQNPPGAPGSLFLHYFIRKAPVNNPRDVETITTLLDVSPNLVSKQTFAYDQYNNVTDTWEYDFGAGAPGPLIRRTHTPYLTTNGNQGNVNYATDYNIHIRNLPIQKIVYDAAGNLRSQTDFIYDNYGGEYLLVDRPGIVQHDGGFHISYGARGNLTEVIQHNPNGSPSEVHLRSQYDIAGNLVKSVDGRGFKTDFDFIDCFGLPDDDARSNSGAPELAGGFSYAFPTKVTNALDHMAYIQYDYYIGRPVNSENANGVVSSVTYNDALDRPTQGIQARNVRDSGVPVERRQTTIAYDDSNHVITMTSDRDTFDDNILTSKSYYDGLGRTRRGAVREGSTWIITDTQFDGLDRVSQVSNPYRDADPGPASAPANLWRTTDYDALGRVIRVVTPDDAHVDMAYNGAQTTVTDPAGKRRRSETDALGRLIKVTEAPGELNYDTLYSYDALGNLRQVTQGLQTRTFVYDSLSRLISATNPESGPVSYAYDENGNLREKIDARGVKTTMTYDALNRVRSKVYAGTPQGGTEVANATPPVNYFYDDYSILPSGAPTWPGTPSKGKLIGVTYGPGSEGTYYKYDVAGRITTNHQRQGTSNYATTYAYNLAGGVMREQRGNYLRNSWIYDNAGRLSGMEASFTPFLSSVHLAKDISYTPFGALQSETYGNGLIHSMSYNERLQPSEIRLGRPDNLESVFRIGYIFGTAHNVNGQDSEITLAHNNGNVARIKYFISGELQYSQTFQYDQLNRLRYAVEHNNGTYNDASRAWYQTFAYDPYGNRGIDVANTSDNADAANHALQLADFSAANNRITHAGYAYDAAGNLIAEPGKSYTYDAENRTVTATVAGGEMSQSFYDGNGRRVKKIVGGVGTRFEYGAGGGVIAERNDAHGAVTKGYC
jgi:YD repeat-containing protein